MIKPILGILLFYQGFLLQTFKKKKSKNAYHIIMYYFL